MFKVNKVHLVLVQLILLGSIFNGIVGPSHAQRTGLVCIASDNANSCPSSPPTLTAPIGSLLTVSILIQDSDPLNGFSVVIVADHTILRPTGVDLTGSVLSGTRTVLAECIGGFPVTGSCAPTDNADTIHLAATQLGNLTTSPTSGMLFTASYNVTFAGSTSINIENLLVSNGTLNPVPENSQGAFYSSSGAADQFTLSAIPTFLTLPPGSNGTSTIMIQSLNFTGTVYLSATVSPGGTTGPTVGLFPSNVTLVSRGQAQSIIFISAAGPSGLTPPGTYALSVIGTGGNTTVSVAITVNVTSISGDFFLTANPGTLNIQAGSIGTSTIQVASLNGFSGQVTITAAPSSSQLNTTLAPSVVNVSPAQAGLSALLVTTTSSTPPGGYSVTITAVSGAIVRMTFISVGVSPISQSAFYSQSFIPNQFVTGGSPLGIHADDISVQIPLNFTFPFYSQPFTSVWVSTNGLISPLSPDSSPSGSLVALSQRFAIAPLWADLRTDTRSGDDIYVTRMSGSIIIRWQAVTFSSLYDVNFEATLNSNGIIQFNYGPSNGSFQATVGISNGAGDALDQVITGTNNIQSTVFTPIRPAHDLQVSLEAPTFVPLGNSTTIVAHVTNLGTHDETNVPLQITINGTMVDSVVIPLLSGNGTSAQLSFIWTPRAEGTYQITASTPPVQGENNTQNNSATTLAAVLQLVGIPDPQGDTYNSGPQLDIAAIDARFNRTSLIFTFTFYTPISPPSQGLPSSVYGYIDIDSDRNPNTGTTSFQEIFGHHHPAGLGDEYFISLFSESAHPGQVDVVNALSFSLAGVAPITFTSHRFTITVPLSIIGNNGFVNYGTVIGNAFAPTDDAPNQCCATSIRIPEHDLSIVSLSASPTRLFVGQTETLTATVANQGTFNESSDLNFFANGTLIGTVHFSLNAGANVTMFFDEDTSSLAPGTYVISARVTPVSGEVTVSDNSLTDGTIRILPAMVTVKLTGSFDYALKEKVRLRIDALVLSASTFQPLSGANVTIRIYDDTNNLIVTAVLAESPKGSGIYEYRSTGTLAALGLNQGEYLVRVQASFRGGPQAYDILLFHIDPPPEQSASLPSTAQPWLMIAALSVGGLASTIFLVSGRRRRASTSRFYG